VDRAPSASEASLSMVTARHQLPEGREVQFHELPRVTRSAFLLEVCGRMPTTEEWLAAEFGDRRR
jgi:hypothetical protein